MEEGLELQHITGNKCRTMLFTLQKDEIDNEETLVTVRDGEEMTGIVSSINPYSRDNYTRQFDNYILWGEDKCNDISKFKSRRDYIPGVAKSSRKTVVPIINIIPPKTDDRNIVFFQSRPENKTYLTVPPKPSKGDYYGIKFWESCDKIVAKYNNSYISKDLVVPNENIIQVLEDEEFKVCNINRTFYTRGINNSFTRLYSKFCYKYNKNFNKNEPYISEFLRYSQDQKGEINVYSKSGLCPFCPCIVFKNIGNSEYNDHLCLTHGVNKLNQLIPNPRYFGIYKFLKDGIVYHHQGATCVICGDVFKISSSKSLSNYMRHYRDEHW